MAVTENPSPGRAAHPCPWPHVGVVMPILNEERHLEEAVDAVLGQDYPGPIELVLALGPSRDRTDEIAHALAGATRGYARCRTRRVAHRRRSTPPLGGLSDDVEVVVRSTGTGARPDYIRTAWDLLEETGAANVGGLMDAEGVTPFERSRGAMTSRLGVGSARFHTGGSSGPPTPSTSGCSEASGSTAWAGTTPGSCAPRTGSSTTGSARVAGRSGSPRLRVAYWPRPTPPALARQYRDYGRCGVVARTHSRDHQRPLPRGAGGPGGRGRRSAPRFRLAVGLAGPAATSP